MRHAKPNRFLLSLTLAILATDAMPAPAAAEPATAWELTPYRIKLLLAVDAGGGFSGGFEQELGSDLASRAAAVVGGSWRLEVLPAPAELRHKLLTSISTIGADSLPAAALDVDKVLLVGVRSTGGRFSIQARELDCVTRLWNTTITAESAQLEALPLQTFGAVLQAFAPLARIESVDGQTATVRLRAAALARRDKDLPALSPGAAFRPVLVKCDTRGAVTAGSAEPIPWTYLSPTGSSGSLVTCRIDTGLTGAAIPDYHPHRQRWAVAVSPSSDSTKLRLVTKADPPAPLEGYEVQAEQSEAPIGRTNREGVVVVPPGPQAVRMLLIRRGVATLARLPIVPGLIVELTLPLAGGDRSLAIEAALAEAEDGLIDLVAKREVLAARIRAAAKGGNMAGGQALLKQLRDAAPADALAARLDQVQQTIAAADATAQPRLTAKLDGLRQLLDKFRAESPADKLEAALKSGAAK